MGKPKRDSSRGNSRGNSPAKKTMSPPEVPLPQGPPSVPGPFTSVPPGSPYQVTAYAGLPAQPPQDDPCQFVHYQASFSQGYPPPPTSNQTFIAIPQGPANNWVDHSNNQPFGGPIPAVPYNGVDSNTLNQQHVTNNQNWRNNRNGNGQIGGGFNHRRNSSNRHSIHKKPFHMNGGVNPGDSPNPNRQQNSYHQDRHSYVYDQSYNTGGAFSNGLQYQSVGYSPGGGVNQQFPSPPTFHPQPINAPPGPYNGPGPTGSPGHGHISMHYPHGNSHRRSHGTSPMIVYSTPARSHSAFPTGAPIAIQGSMGSSANNTPRMTSQRPVSMTASMPSGAPNAPKAFDNPVTAPDGTHNINDSPLIVSSDQMPRILPSTAPLLATYDALPESDALPGSERSQTPRGLRPRAPSYYPKGHASPPNGQPEWGTQYMKKEASGSVRKNAPLADAGFTIPDEAKMTVVEQNETEDSSQNRIASPTNEKDVGHLQGDRNTAVHSRTVSKNAPAYGPEEKATSLTADKTSLSLPVSAITDIPETIHAIPALVEAVLATSPAEICASLGQTLVYHLNALDSMIKQRDEYIHILGTQFENYYNAEKEAETAAHEYFTAAIQAFENSIKFSDSDSGMRKYWLNDSLLKMKRALNYQARSRVQKKNVESARSDIEKLRLRMFDDQSLFIRHSLSSVQNAMEGKLVVPGAAQETCGRESEETETKQNQNIPRGNSDMKATGYNRASTVALAIREDFTGGASGKLATLQSTQDQVSSEGKTLKEPTRNQNITSALEPSSDGCWPEDTAIPHDLFHIVTEKPRLTPEGDLSPASATQNQCTDIDEVAQQFPLQRNSVKISPENGASSHHTESFEVPHESPSILQNGPVDTLQGETSKSTLSVSGAPPLSKLALAFGQQPEMEITVGNPPTFTEKTFKSPERENNTQFESEIRERREKERPQPNNQLVDNTTTEQTEAKAIHAFRVQAETESKTGTIEDSEKTPNIKIPLDLPAKPHVQSTGRDVTQRSVQDSVPSSDPGPAQPSAAAVASGQTIDQSSNPLPPQFKPAPQVSDPVPKRNQGPPKKGKKRNNKGGKNKRKGGDDANAKGPFNPKGGGGNPAVNPTVNPAR